LSKAVNKNKIITMLNFIIEHFAHVHLSVYKCDYGT
jgi:hypothetical protein